MRTRVGYAGGTKALPTYLGIGDHSEAVEVTFDPRVISYEQLLHVFWDSHEATAGSWSRQYRCAALTAGEEQERVARASRDAIAGAEPSEVTTAIEPLGRFWPAEAYHQKYRLRHDHALWNAVVDHYGSEWAAIDSTVAARLNGLLAGHGSATELAAALEADGFTPEVRERMANALRLAHR